MNSRSEKLTNRVPKGLYWADGSNFILERMPKGLISNSDDTDLDTSVLAECLNCQTLTRNHCPQCRWQSIMVNVTTEKTWKAKKLKRLDIKLIQLDFSLKRNYKFRYNWVTSALYKFSESSVGLSGIVYNSARLSIRSPDNRGSLCMTKISRF